MPNPKILQKRKYLSSFETYNKADWYCPRTVEGKGKNDRRCMLVILHVGRDIITYPGVVQKHVWQEKLNKAREQGFPHVDECEAIGAEQIRNTLRAMRKKYALEEEKGDHEHRSFNKMLDTAKAFWRASKE